MTVDEIKRDLSMPDLVRRYGIQVNRNGMCSCPWHGQDRHPSMKIYDDSFRCFTCGESGDVFSFVQKMEGCDFKTAFMTLGGTYEHHQTRNPTARAFSKSRIKAARDERHVKTDIYRVGGRIWNELNQTIDWCRFIEAYHKPFTIRWCTAVDALPELDYIYTEIFCTKDGKKDIDGPYILARCKKIRQRLFFGN
jgi:hypothetical protein